MPTSANFITVTRYHVKYIRSDGRNTQGVDVPFEFDGGCDRHRGDRRPATKLAITLVRVQAKLEAPLKALGESGRRRGDLDDRRDHALRQGPGRPRRARSRATITVNFADFADASRQLTVARSTT